MAIKFQEGGRYLVNDLQTSMFGNFDKKEQIIEVVFEDETKFKLRKQNGNVFVFPKEWRYRAIECFNPDEVVEKDFSKKSNITEYQFEGAKLQMEKEIREAIVFLRKHNHTIPSDTIEFMKVASLSLLSKE